MAKQSPAPAPQPKASPQQRDAVLAQIKGETRRLDQLRRHHLDQIIELESRNIVEERPSADASPRQRALELVNGLAPPVATTLPAGIQLWTLRREIEAIDEALKLLGDRAVQEKAIIGAAWLAEHGPEEREREHQLCLTVLALRRIARERQAFRDQGRHWFGADPPSAMYKFRVGPIFGPPISGDWCHEFLEAACRAGIITRKEIDHA